MRILEALFLVSVAFSTYTLLGYPVLLALLARWRSRPVHKAFVPKSVTVLLPVRNGERWLRAKLESLLTLHYPRGLLQIIVISDGSTDATDSIGAEFAATGLVEFTRVAQGGKALALNAGLQMARGEILFFTDVRQPIEPDSLQHMVACFSDPSVGVVSGELVIGDGHTLEEHSLGLYWKHEKWLRRQESRIDSMMGATGCIYAMRSELALPLPARTLADDMFLPLAAFVAGYRIVMDEHAKALDHPTALKREFQRKVRTLAGVYQIIGVYPRLLWPGNRMWIAFVSHKVARLFLPYALLIAAVTSLALPEPWGSMLFGAQAMFYAMAVVDWCIPERWPVKRITSVSRTFVVLMAAAVCAVRVLLPITYNLWKELPPIPSVPTMTR